MKINYSINDLYELFWSILAPIDEPQSRLYFLNILSSLVIIGFWIYFKNQKFKPRTVRNHFFKMIKIIIFNSHYWLNRSSLQDVGLYLINGLLKVIIWVPALELSFYIAQFILYLKQQLNLNFLVTPSSVNIFLFTLIAFIFDDFMRFYHHYLSHRVKWLWRFHRVHHGASVLTPITLFRTHPIEAILGVLRNSLVLGILTGFFIVLFNSPLNLWTIAGVNGFGYLLNLLGATLRHSQIPIEFGFLEKVLISPKQHQIHHSSDFEHLNKNFGVNLAIWDLLFKSLVYSQSVNKKLRYGIYSNQIDKSVRLNYLGSQ